MRPNYKSRGRDPTAKNTYTVTPHSTATRAGGPDDATDGRQTTIPHFTALEGGALPPLRAPQPRLLLLFRHIEKTGGTSLRSSFVASHCQFFGYDFTDSTRKRLQQFAQDQTAYSQLAKKPATEVVNNRSTSVACVEAHIPAPRAPAFVALGAEARQWGPRVLLLLLVRRPTAHYVSYFRWSHAPLARNETSLAYSNRLLRWAPPNLQTNILSTAYRGQVATRWCCGESSSICCGGEASRIPATPPTFEAGGGAFCDGVLSAAEAFDLLLTTESMSSVGLSLLRRVTGLELPMRRISVWPRYSGGGLTPPRLSFDHANLTARLLEVAPCDWRLYALAQARMAIGQQAAGRQRSPARRHRHRRRRR